MKYIIVFLMLMLPLLSLSGCYIYSKEPPPQPAIIISPDGPPPPPPSGAVGPAR
jgi:hypothetical protein